MSVTWEEHGWERLSARAGRRRLPGWDCTAGLVAGAEGVLLVDAGSSLAEGAELRRQAEALTGRPVTHVALTHPHFDHVFGAAAFPDAVTYAPAGMAELLRRPSAREELRADAVANGLDADLAEEAVAALVAPSVPVDGALRLDLGGGTEAVLADVGPGHTGHDLAVLVPGSPAVVLCGDLVEESGPPQAGPDAVPHAWPAALDRLLALGGAHARYVPGHGAVVDAGFVRRQREELAGRSGTAR